MLHLLRKHETRTAITNARMLPFCADTELQMPVCYIFCAGTYLITSLMCGSWEPNNYKYDIVNLVYDDANFHNANYSAAFVSRRLLRFHIPKYDQITVTYCCFLPIVVNNDFFPYPSIDKDKYQKTLKPRCIHHFE